MEFFVYVVMIAMILVMLWVLADLVFA